MYTKRIEERYWIFVLFCLAHHFSLLFLFSCITKHLDKSGSNILHTKSMASPWPHLWSYNDHISHQAEDSSNDVTNDVIAMYLPLLQTVIIMTNQQKNLIEPHRTF